MHLHSFFVYLIILFKGGKNMNQPQYLKSFLESVNQNNLDNIDEILYYYGQGFEMGKEETAFIFANRLLELNVDEKIIIAVTKLSKKEIEQIKK